MEIVNNLAEDPTTYEINKGTFVIGAYSTSDTNDILYDPTYIKVTAEQVTITKDEVGGTVTSSVTTPLTVDLCGTMYYDVIGESLSILLDTDTFYCIQDTDIKIGGNFLSTEYNYIQWYFSKWTGDPSCQADADIDTALDTIGLGFMITNYYFDAEDYKDPIKINLDTNYDFSIISGYTKELKLMIQSNEASDLNQPWPMQEPNMHNYFSVGGFKYDMYTADDEVFATTIVALDSKFTNVERTVFSISEFMALIGGMKEMLLLLGGSIVGFFQSKLYTGSLMNGLFYIQTERKSSPVKTHSYEVNRKNNQVEPFEEMKNSSVRVYVANPATNSMEKVVTTEDPMTSRSNATKDILKDKLQSYKRFHLKLTDIIWMNIWFPGILCRNGKSEFSKTYKQYKEGEKKILNELDIITILNNLRKTSMMVSTTMTEQQKLLATYQKVNILGLPEAPKSFKKSQVHPQNHKESDSICTCLMCIDKILSELGDLKDTDKFTQKLAQNILEQSSENQNNSSSAKLMNEYSLGGLINLDYEDP